jgi:predicted transcriptional regulator
MAANKRNPTERTRDLETLSRLYVKGRTQAEIAAELGISQPQVAYDLKDLRERWKASQDRTKAEELARIDAIEAEAWKGHSDSQDHSEKAAYLRTALSCVEKRCKLLGFDAPEKHDVKLSTDGFIEALGLLRSRAGDSAVAAVLSKPAPLGSGAGS